MRYISWIVGVGIALLLVVAGLFFFTNGNGTANKCAERIDRCIAPYVNKGDFSGAVYVSKGGQVVFHKAYGLADRSRNVPNTLETKFWIGSTTKPMTAALILKLQELGLLNISDPITKYLPQGYANANRSNVERNGVPVTIKHLLNHTSGIPGYYDFIPEDKDEAAKKITSLKILTDSFSKAPLRFVPGTKHEYSNSNYVLLANIANAVSPKRSYRESMSDYIFGPCGMISSGCGLLPGGFAYGYTKEDSQYEDNVDWFEVKIDSGDGNVYSTVLDLQKFVRGLLGGKIISRQLLNEMLTPGKGDYGYGWGIETDENGRKNIFHDGALGGYVSTIRIYPKEGVIITITSNLDTAPLSDIVECIEDILFGL